MVKGSLLKHKPSLIGCVPFARLKIPDEPVSVDDIQQKLPATFERLSDLSQNFFVLCLAFKVAEGCEHVDDSIKLVSEINFAHVAMKESHTQAFAFSPFPCSVKERFGQVNSDNLKATPCQFKAVPALPAA
jgi:hypothetical protein